MWYHNDFVLIFVLLYSVPAVIYLQLYNYIILYI